jgi:hypothetical protein
VPGVEALIDAVLVLDHGRTFRLTPLADGFRLEGGIDGESGWFRYWPLEPSVGAISTTDGNVVERVWVRGCRPGRVAWPASTAPSGSDMDFELHLRWPAACAARIDDAGEAIRYEVRLSDADPARWAPVPGAAAFVALAADGALTRIVAEASRVALTWHPVLVRAGGYVAHLQAGRLLSLVREAWLEPTEDDVPLAALESAHGNAWLERWADDSLASLTVEDVAAGEAIEVPGDAPAVDELNLWQRWPAAVQATCWQVAGRTVVAVRFGAAGPERWARLGEDDVWAGSSSDGELRTLVLGDVEEPPARLDRPGFFRDSGATFLGDDILATAGSIRFEIYGLAGAVGTPVGFGSTHGVPSTFAITFGDADSGGPWLTVSSARGAGRRSARRDALSRLAADDAEVSDDHAEWEAIEIPVDGDPAAFDLSRLGDGWVAVGRVARTTITIVSHGYPPDEVALEVVRDLAPHVEQGRAQFGAPAQNPSEEDSAASERARAAAALGALDDLLDAIDRNAGAPAIGSVFTERVVETWGGRDRYERLLWLHTMLRPVSGWSGGAPTLGEDGFVTMCISLRHGVPGIGGGAVSMSVNPTRGAPKPEPPPDPAAIRRGEGHEIAFRIVEEGGGWRIDTDLLRILVERLGSLEEVVRPLSEQVG